MWKLCTTLGVLTSSWKIIKNCFTTSISKGWFPERDSAILAGLQAEVTRWDSKTYETVAPLACALLTCSALTPLCKSSVMTVYVFARMKQFSASTAAQISAITRMILPKANITSRKKSDTWSSMHCAMDLLCSMRHRFEWLSFFVSEILKGCVPPCWSTMHCLVSGFGALECGRMALDLIAVVATC